MKNIAVFGNPTSINAVSLVKDIAEILRYKQIQHELFLYHWITDLGNFTDAWVIGGDGTLQRFINQYPQIQIPICLFKAGTGNDLYFTLYNDLPTPQLIERVLNENHSISIDVGECNGRLFTVGVGIGFDGAVVHNLQGKKMLAGKASYFPSILKELTNFKESSYTIQLGNGTTIEQDCFLISIANVRRYGGEYFVAPKALVTDGLLDINIVGKVAGQNRIVFLSALTKGEHINQSMVSYYQTNTVQIASSTPIHAHIDGEYIKASHFTIRLATQKLRFSGASLPI